jgi:hypothetical protein
MSSRLRVETGDGAVEVWDGDAHRWTYAFGARRRPFVHPLRAPAGPVLTVDAPDDHPWHHGLWFTIKFVDGENFWEEYDAYGVLRHRGEPTVEVRADASVTIAGDLDWIRPDRESVALTEHRRWTHRPLDDRTYAIDFDTTLTAPRDVVLDRTPFTTWGGYGGLAFRGRPDLRDTRILLADGTVTDRVEGVPGEWFDLSGTVDGRPVGVTMVDAPGNPTDPVPWYGSTRHETYGADDDQWSNFFNAAFLFHAARPLPADQPLRFRYRVVVHDDLGDHGQLSELADDYRRGVDG